jgi:hypothetical protein
MTPGALVACCGFVPRKRIGATLTAILWLALLLADDREVSVAQREYDNTDLQMLIPGCERRTLPKSCSTANWAGQGLLGFYAEPTLGEKLALRADARLTARRPQMALPRTGLFRS